MYQPSNPNYNGTRFENGEDIAFRLEYSSEAITPAAEFNRERELVTEAEQAFDRTTTEQTPTPEVVSAEKISAFALSVAYWLKHSREEETQAQKSDFTLAS